MPQCEIETHGNKFSSKLEGTIRLHFEKVNSLPTTKYFCQKDKIRSLRHVWSKLNVDFIA